MTIEKFVASCLDGTVETMGGGEKDGVRFTTFGPIKITDPEAITAEAFNQDVLPESTTWDKGLAQVKAVIAGGLR